MPSVLLHLKKEMDFTLTQDCHLQIGPVSWKNLPSSLYPCLQKLCSQGISENEVLDLVQDQEDLVYFYCVVEECRSTNMLYESLCHEGQMHALYRPLVPIAAPLLKEFSGDEEMQVSRFAYLSLQDGTWRLHSPLSSAEILIYNESYLTLLQLMADKTKVRDLYTKSSLSKKAIDLFLSYLSTMKIVGEEESTALQHWEFHDLLFHVNSRKGRHSKPYGATYRFKGKIAPLPVIKPLMSNERLSLYKPDLEVLKKQDATLTEVLESRSSIREYSQVITDRELGEFLYRSARVKQVLKRELQDLSKRVYPGGGAIYELELYPLIQHCKGIVPGLYHYDPYDHILEKINAPSSEISLFTQDASLSTGLQSEPQVIFLIAARFQRLSWKYQSMAYAAMLKNTGALLQTMYLVATAMKLAPCAIGGGNAEHFSRVIESDYYVETTIGEFLLGAK